MSSLIDPSIVVPFLLAVAAVEFTPGPNMAYLAALSLAQGRGAGFSTVVGITLALTTYMLVSVFGLTEIFLIYRPLYEALRLAGVAYLLWLAWDTWRETVEVATSSQAMPSRWRLMMRGFMANILNPKVAVFYITLLPAFTNENRGSVPLQVLLLGGLHIVVSILVHSTIVVGAAYVLAEKRRTLSPEGMVVLRRFFALLLAVVAVWLLFETRLKTL